MCAPEKSLLRLTEHRHLLYGFICWKSMYQITDPEIKKQLLEMWNNKMQNSGEDNIEISGNWFVFYKLNDKLETGIFALHALQVSFINQPYRLLFGTFTDFYGPLQTITDKGISRWFIRFCPLPSVSVRHIKEWFNCKFLLSILLYRMAPVFQKYYH